MMSLLQRILHHGEHVMEDALKEAHLLNAERDLDDLKARAAVALGKIDARNKRNHWQESIDLMIREAKKR